MSPGQSKEHRQSTTSYRARWRLPYFAFRDFESLSFGVVADVRSYTVVDAIFGPVLFVGVLLSNGTVEIASFITDPDYWTLLAEEAD